ncbi:polymorphic toxin-type HINT domain-containing protein [Dactylosporangium sp. NPDC006015]|uniref:polymorphic toxin-type HINT domain-containing protein n=1 Tax=Dactylosporangium sp. NPDC006015 TaxID=3154576 RepID=UPI0033B83D26
MLSVTLAGGAVSVLPAHAAPVDPFAAQPNQVERIVPEDKSRRNVVKPIADAEQDIALKASPPVVWPRAETSTVDLAARRLAAEPARTNADVVSPAKAGPTRAGGSPVFVGDARGGVREDLRKVPLAGPQAVQVEVYDRARTAKSGVDGLLLRVSRPDRTMSTDTIAVEVDYSGFRAAYGGAWSSRLRLVELPDCAATTPELSACRTGRKLAATNDTGAARIGGDVTLAGGATKLLAVQAGVQGSAGNFGATSLTTSSSWGAGGATGEFTWSYPLRVPPANGGPSPSISLSYASSGVDGRTNAANNQTSWIGMGFEFSPGQIERRYKPCASDMEGAANNKTRPTGDMCWFSDNATISLNGHSSELVQVGTTNFWKLKDDDGSIVEQLFDAGRGNGDDNGEYWKFTSPDGTQYYLGYNRLPGWSGGETTQSTFTLPVYGNHPGEACYQSSFQNSACRQGYKWNVDYVVDVNGNTMSYFYDPETNKYARYGEANSPDWYTRGGNLKRIEYGQRSNAVTSTPALARVLFETGDRCLPNTNCNDAWNWPDTPMDLNCSAAPCTQTFSPAFFTKRRLKQVDTEVLNNNGVGYRPVDRWTLRHSYVSGDAATGYALWLDGITQTGRGATPEIVMPEVTFDGTFMPNRVDDLANNIAPLNWRRIIGITNENGGTLAVRYAPTNCSRTNLPASPATNTQRCMPVKGSDDAYPNRIDYFHKYIVDRVTQSVSGYTVPAVTQVVTDYDYVGDAAWRFDELDGITPEEDKTWSQWRGYGTVVTYTGDGVDGTRGKTESRFYRGMHGDRTATAGVFKTVNVTDSRGGSVPDEDRFTGMTRETTQFLDATTRLSTSIADFWVSAATASQTRPWGVINATKVATTATSSFTYLSPTNVRETRVVNTLAADGTITAVHNMGVVGDVNDDECTKYTFASSSVAYLPNRPVRAQKLSAACSVADPPKADVLSDSRTYYDGSDTLGYVGARGLVTRVDEFNGFTGANASSVTYQTKSKTVYDAGGNMTDSYDVKQNWTHTDYTRSGNGPITRITTTDPIGHVTYLDSDPAWGAPVVNGDSSNATAQGDVKTEVELDALGRVLKVWGPTRIRGADTPNTTYQYLIQRNAPPVVMSTTLQSPSQVTGSPAGTLAPQYTSKYEIYDGLLRLRQTQIASPSGGRSVNTIDYDSQNRIVKRSGPINNDAPSGFNYLPLADASLPNQIQTTYDGASRVTAEILFGHNSSGLFEKWRTTTTYNGDQISTTPPAGAGAATVTYDPQGRVSKLWQYKTGVPTPSDPTSYDETKYSYAKDGQQSVVEDSAGNKWEYFYDDLHRTKETREPDRGTSKIEYNQYGEVVKTIDARNYALGITYDTVGRPLELKDVTSTPEKRLATWTYDTLKKGLLTSSSRWVGADEYRNSVVEYDHALRPVKTSVGIPMIEGGLAGTYTYEHTFNFDGSPKTTKLPAAGSLAAETLTYGYNTWGLPISLAGASSYVQASAYNSFAEPLSVTVGATGAGNRSMLLQFTYEEATRRLLTSSARPNGGASAYNAKYTYDAVGNVTSASDQPALTGQPQDHQCFQYDYLRRMTEAWTPATLDCTTANRTTANLGGPAPYWSSYTFDKTGNRTTEQKHELPGEPTKHYVYGTGHKLGSTTVGGSTLTSYQYDASGNTTQRVVGGSTQTLKWNSEGKLATVTEGTKVTEYLNDAAGSRLIRRDDTGTTLYLPGQEIHKSTSGVNTATRYYSHGGMTVAVRTDDNKLTYLASDPHGTATLAMDASTGTFQKRRATPFGEDRGAAVVGWPGDKGFIGGTKDQSTGLTHLGAREYDPTLGRFISVDPLTIPQDPQRLNGYAYGNNAPIVNADPTGEAFPGDPTHQTADEMKLYPPAEGTGLTPKELAERAEAEATKKKSLMDIILEQGLAFLLDFLGITDIVDCIRSGKVSSCVNALIGLFPSGRVLKSLKSIVKGVERAFSAYQSWQKAMKIANDVIKRTDDLIAAARKKADELAANIGAGAKKADNAAGGVADEASNAAGGAANAGTSGGRRCRKHSFDADTPVRMADGSTEPIGDVQAGDEVLATDPETGDTTARVVTRKHVNLDSDLVDVIIAVDDGIETMSTTQRHPFWSETRGTWVDAADLLPGERVHTLDGKVAVVLGITLLNATRIMHDLTVADVHTYYVVAGEASVLVHNCGSGQAPNGISCSCTAEQDTYDGPPLTVDEARAAAESYGIGTQSMDLRYIPRDDPYWEPNRYAWTHFNFADRVIRTPGGRSTTDLTDMALRSPRTAALTIGHELAHAVFEAPADHAGAEQWALDIMRHSMRRRR